MISVKSKPSFIEKQVPSFAVPNAGHRIMFRKRGGKLKFDKVRDAKATGRSESSVSTCDKTALIATADASIVT